MKKSGKTISLNDLSLRQKLAQMIIVRGELNRKYYNKIGVGGIFFGNKNTKEEFEELFNVFKKDCSIEPFFCADLEGAWNPFKKFKTFSSFSEIKNKSDAYKLGVEQGKYLKKLGFNMNFSPVAESSDKVYKKRTFKGSAKEIEEKLRAYVKGLQKYVHGTGKHYPGRSLTINQHVFVDREKITKEDLDLFNGCFSEKISAVMTSHTVCYGEVDSKGLPMSVSSNAISELKKKFKGLVIADDVNMLALRLHSFSKKKTYKRVINAGNDMIIDVGFLVGRYGGIKGRQLSRILNYLEKEVKAGRIDESRINRSVTKILIVKGYVVK